VFVGTRTIGHVYAVIDRAPELTTHRRHDKLLLQRTRSMRQLQGHAHQRRAPRCRLVITAIGIGDDDRTDVGPVRHIVDAQELGQPPALAALLETGAQIAHRVGGGELAVLVVHEHLAAVAQLDPGMKTARGMAPHRFGMEQIRSHARQPVARRHRDRQRTRRE